MEAEVEVEEAEVEVVSPRILRKLQTGAVEKMASALALEGVAVEALAKDQVP